MIIRIPNAICRDRLCASSRLRAVIVLLIFALAAAQTFAAPRLTLRLEYTLSFTRPASHLLQVEIQARNVREPSLDFVMPAWAPGRYAIYNFAKNVQQFEATGETGKPLPWINTDKQTWRVDTRDARGVVTVRYRVFANNLTGSFSQLDPTHANVNGASLYMYVAGHKRDPIALRIDVPPGERSSWKIYSGFSLSLSQTEFQAPNYDRMIDTPMDISPSDQAAQFTDHSKTFRVVVHAYGEGSESPARWTASLAAGLEKIVHAEMAMMPAPDFSAYTFLFHVSPFIREGDGMEHLNSTEIMVRGVPDESTLSEALATAAHEFFHVWNVKRLRPAALGPFDYTREDYTPSLWFAEGVTQYYSYVFLLRSGIWSKEQFLGALATEAKTLRDDPGRKLMSAESSSFHAWFYDRAPQMQETNFANATISYYNKGALLGMLLDLAVRERTGGRKSLDDVMRWMYRRFYEGPPATYYLPGRGYTESDILNALNTVSGSDFTDFFNRYVRGTEALPYAKVLAGAGLDLMVATRPGSAPSLGVLTMPAATGLRIAAVRPGTPAAAAGLSRGDILIAVDQLPLAGDELGDRLRMYHPGASVPFTVERYGKREIIFAKLAEPLPNDFTIHESPNAAPQAKRIAEEWLSSSHGERP